MISKATVVGAGAMGTVCAHVLAENGVNVALLVRREEMVQELLVTRENQRYLPGLRLSPRIKPTSDPAAALAFSELVISAAPCQFARSVWMPLRALVPPEAPVCSVTKGLELRSLLRPSEVLRSLLPESQLAVLSGPSIAPELARCLPATVVVASEREAVAQCVQTAMSTSWLRVYTSRDSIGVELAGAVKNVIALAAGILDGLHAGDNCKAALVTRGLVEITRLGLALGARPETFTGLAGVGDLITTCVSPLGRNRTAGERIGRGEDVEHVVSSSRHVIEGIPTTQAVLQLAERCGVELPITEAVASVLFAGKRPLAAITELMNRPLKAED
jgi:glycerol-3-phosphate dehydrogenase (NAD(P)+)